MCRENLKTWAGRLPRAAAVDDVGRPSGSAPRRLGLETSHPELRILTSAWRWSFTGSSASARRGGLPLENRNTRVLISGPSSATTSLLSPFPPSAGGLFPGAQEVLRLVGPLQGCRMLLWKRLGLGVGDAPGASRSSRLGSPLPVWGSGAFLPAPCEGPQPAAQGPRDRPCGDVCALPTAPELPSRCAVHLPELCCSPGLTTTLSSLRSRLFSLHPRSSSSPRAPDILTWGQRRQAGACFPDRVESV